MVTPLKRKSIDIGIFGNKSYGKTITMTALGLLFWLSGHKVFTNYWVKYPHIKIDSLEGLKQIGQYSQDKRKIVLMEDFERWVHSRNAQDKTNLDIDAIVIDFGKNNASLIYTSKRPMAIDIALRDTTDFFLETKMIMPFKPNTKSKELDDIIINLWCDDFEMLWVQITILDANGKEFPLQYLTNLLFWGSLYETQEIIKNLKT